MGPMCIPVYGIAEELETEYKHVKFFDMELTIQYQMSSESYLKYMVSWESHLQFTIKMVKWLKLLPASRLKTR